MKGPLKYRSLNQFRTAVFVSSYTLSMDTKDNLEKSLQRIRDVFNPWGRAYFNFFSDRGIQVTDLFPYLLHICTVRDS